MNYYGIKGFQIFFNFIYFKIETTSHNVCTTSINVISLKIDKR